MQSKFSLVDGRFLFHDEKVVAVISDSRYSRPLLYRMEQLEVEDGTVAALQILCYLATAGELSDKVRLPTPADHTSAKSAICGPPTRYGHKHTCVKCSQKFFDLNGKIDKCPSCKTQIALEP
jgi:hypothetical protein